MIRLTIQAILNVYIQLGYVTETQWHGSHAQSQIFHPGVKKFCRFTHWMGFMDVDEFTHWLEQFRAYSVDLTIGLIIVVSQERRGW
jgi:hypothetical protein